MVYEIQRNNTRIIKEKIADYIDPPRSYPKIGEAQLHHVHYKCTVCCDKSTKVGWPITHTATEKQVTDVLYIDHNHLHVFPNKVNGSEQDGSVALTATAPSE